MMARIDPYTMSSGEVGRALGVTGERVRQLDDELQPKRRANGRRYYDPRVVQVVANRRARWHADRRAGRRSPLATSPQARSALLARIDALSQAIVDLRAEVAHELGLDGDDEIAQLAAADLQRASRRARGGRP